MESIPQFKPEFYCLFIVHSTPLTSSVIWTPQVPHGSNLFPASRMQMKRAGWLLGDSSAAHHVSGSRMSQKNWLLSPSCPCQQCRDPGRSLRASQASVSPYMNWKAGLVDPKGPPYLKLLLFMSCQIKLQQTVLITMSVKLMQYSIRKANGSHSTGSGKSQES